MNKRQIINMHKLPSTADNYVGVELEFISTKNMDQLKVLFCEHNLHRYVHVGTDGSVDESDEYPNSHEVRILAKESEIFDIVQQVCNVLEDNSEVNYSCGLHIHFDMRNKVFLKPIVKNLLNAQPYLEKLVHPSREGRHYCKRNTRVQRYEDGSDVGVAHPTEIPGTPLLDALTRNKVRDIAKYTDRYTAINISSLNKYNTIECRLHHGTLDATEINNWIKLLLRIIGSRKKLTFSNLKSMNLPPELHTYYARKLRKYNNEWSDNVLP